MHISVRTVLLGIHLYPCGYLPLSSGENETAEDHLHAEPVQDASVHPDDRRSVLRIAQKEERESGAGIPGTELFPRRKIIQAVL